MEGPARVPAWKRLGLKLKYAQEIETSTSLLPTSQQINSNGTPAAAICTSRVNEQPVTSPPPKKRRLEGHLSTPAERPVHGLQRSSSLKSLRPKVRKSVSFTPETKEDDGESSNFMQEKWDEEARNDQINEFLEREAEALRAAETIKASRNIEGPEAIRAAVQLELQNFVPEFLEDEQRAKQTKPPGKSKDALDYLEQYQSSRSTWKFNKNREVWLLKHVLSTSDIPSESETALFEYLAGMKSEKAKTRLLDQCHDFIVDEFESKSDDGERALISKSLKMDTTPRRLAYYRAASQRFENDFDLAAAEDVDDKAQDLAMTRHNRVARATRLLESMLPSHGVEAGESEIPGSRDPEVVSRTHSSPKGAEEKSVVKKKKNRTAVVDISSSEDTSSDDSSDSDT